MQAVPPGLDIHEDVLGDLFGQLITQVRPVLRKRRLSRTTCGRNSFFFLVVGENKKPSNPVT